MPKARWVAAAIVAALALGLALVAWSVWRAAQEPAFLSVQQVIDNRDALSGQRIRVRGPLSGSSETVQGVECEPFRCSCATVLIEHYLDGFLVVSQCVGNLCTLKCSPLGPDLMGQQLELVGTLSLVGTRLDLTDIDFAQSRHLVEGTWVPLSGGEFVVPYETPPVVTVPAR